ncbi:MAG: phenylalanine--tRNA ligase subunit beta, partial [Chloroflexi bacterium]|nr:phenylalanine--tRNA ligase subunit beta [Chloroflexota bacterium]
MKISLKWLREYVPITLPPEELAHRLTMAGIEVGEIHTVGGSWDNIFVGHVARVIKHPNADRLTLCTVDLPNETFEVVCGAPNVAEGQNIAFAKLGARLLDGHSGKTMTLKAAKIRGVVSQGMICSEKELGLSDEHEGILVLSPDAPLGAPLIDHLGDSILELEVTPNRPDCLSMLGVAWEVAALTGAVVSMPEISYEEHDSPIEKLASVEIADPDLCARYTASVVTGLKVAESPHWMQERLLAAGMRPINNIVDITNYVMLEYGQPLHAFDYDGIEDGKIIVRRARAGERLLTLDGESRPLDPEMLAIADPSGPVGLAGVMGGLDTEISDKTRNVLIESAWFQPASIRRTSRHFAMHTEASHRFERGADIEAASWAADRIAGLLGEVSPGSVLSGLLDAYPAPRQREAIDLRRKRIIR